MGSIQEDKVTLYWLDKSRSQRVLWLLEDLEVPHDLQILHRGEDKFAPPESKAIHPLGKFPVLAVEADEKRVVIAESARITEYLCEHYDGEAKGLVPARYAPGKGSKLAGETESYMRYCYFMHYAEGSLMSFLVADLIVRLIPDQSVSAQMGHIFQMSETMATHLSFLESQLNTAPNGGPYLCGPTLTAADILMSFPIIAIQDHGVAPREQYPVLNAYADRLRAEKGYKKAVAKIEEIDGEKFVDVM